MRISYHCWTESLVDLAGRSINSPQYYMFQMGNKHLNKDDYMALLQWFLLIDDRTRSKFTIDCC